MELESLVSALITIERSIHFPGAIQNHFNWINHTILLVEQESMSHRAMLINKLKSFWPTTVHRGIDQMVSLPPWTRICMCMWSGHSCLNQQSTWIYLFVRHKFCFILDGIGGNVRLPCLCRLTGCAFQWSNHQEHTLFPTWDMVTQWCFLFCPVLEWIATVFFWVWTYVQKGPCVGQVSCPMLQWIERMLCPFRFMLCVQITDFQDTDIVQCTKFKLDWISKFEENYMKTKPKLLQNAGTAIWKAIQYKSGKWYKIQAEPTSQKRSQWRFFPVVTSQACKTWFTISSTPSPCFTCIYKTYIMGKANFDIFTRTMK